jgi:hypothetical protein
LERVTLFDEEKQDLEMFSTRISKPLVKEVKKAAIDLGLKVQGLAAFSYELFLYFKKNSDLSNSPMSVDIA